MCKGNYFYQLIALPIRIYAYLYKIFFSLIRNFFRITRDIYRNYRNKKRALGQLSFPSSLFFVIMTKADELQKIMNSSAF